MSDDTTASTTDGRDGYVHDPSAFGADGEPTESADRHGEKPRGEDREFGIRGWILVAWVVIALVVVPSYLFFFPRAGQTVQLFGLGFRDTYLFVPLLPALVLGALAVWATTRP
ncbi:hypothetical protein [Halorarius litoreus]|uniref:hypothetical protein n=1 Tax=Halorarius litoreus TaxID=2962676 RepID=UPI0020CD79E1|nr:hypothetical protein [Halorarius litoreus]